MGRRSALIYIHVFVLVQLLLPASYYLWREDHNDERFAWRMFSYDRMLECKPSFLIGDTKQPVPLYANFHDAWIEVAKRGRRQVIEAMAAKLCEDHDDLRIVVRCQNRADRKPGQTPEQAAADRPDPFEFGSPLWNVCPSGKIK